ncbi:MAG: hypothetical protein K2Y27_28760 [Xanthobacteraceae bacterium]|nr:hypothetical protein [Xanthobacteraceae bacterium]
MRLCRTVLVASLLAAGLTLSGCESFDPESWFSTKKPLPGERRPMFPGGVPGVPQGVPQDMVKGYQPPPDNPPEVVTAEPKPKPAPKPRPAPAPRQAAAPRQAPPPQPQEQQSAPPQASPWPAPSQPQAQAPSPFPDPPRR